MVVGCALAVAARPQVADRRRAVTGRVDLRASATIRCGARSSERPAGMAEAVREQRQVAAGVPAEVVDQQVRRREDRSEEPDDERR